MFLVPLLIAATLQTCPTYSGPNDGAIHICGHAYRLTCARSGAPRECSAPRQTPADVDHFELRDEGNRLMLEKDAPGGALFTDVGTSGTGYPDHPQLFAIDVGRHDSSESAPTVHYTYYFHATASGLTEFHPALGCGSGTGAMLSSLGKWPASGLAFACEFDASYFRFAARLLFDLDHHQIVLSPPPEQLSLAGEPDQLTAQAAASASLRVYRDHEESSHGTEIQLNRGQRIRMVDAWTPVSLATKDGIATVTYDPAKLWLQIELNHSKYWIFSKESFRAIGLKAAAR